MRMVHLMAMLSKLSPDEVCQLKPVDFMCAAQTVRLLLAPRDLREVIAVIARAFGWSLAEIKRMPFGELVEYGGLAARVPVSRILGGGAQ